MDAHALTVGRIRLTVPCGISSGLPDQREASRLRASGRRGCHIPDYASWIHQQYRGLRVTHNAPTEKALLTQVHVDLVGDTPVLPFDAVVLACSRRRNQRTIGSCIWFVVGTETQSTRSTKRTATMQRWRKLTLEGSGWSGRLNRCSTRCVLLCWHSVAIGSSALDSSSPSPPAISDPRASEEYTCTPGRTEGRFRNS